MGTENVYYIISTQYYFNLKKEENSAMWNNMNGPWGHRHYAEYSKPDRKRQILYDLTYVASGGKKNKNKNW